MSSKSVGLALAAIILLVGVDVVVVGVDAVDVARRAGALFDYPYCVDHGEGLVLAQVFEIRHGRSVYTPFADEPWVVGNYPPVYLWATAWLAPAFDSAIAAGRALSIGATALAAAFIALLVIGTSRVPVVDERGAGPRRTSLLVRSLVGVVAGLVFLSWGPIYHWAPLLRVDVLAIALALVGLWAHLAFAARPRLAWLGVLLFLLALYTKHSTVSGPAAAFLTAVAFRGRAGWRLLIGFLVLGGGLFALGDLVLDGELFRHLVLANRTEFRRDQGLYYYWAIGRQHGVLLVPLIVGSIAGFAALRGPRHQGPTARRAAEWRWAVLLFLCCSLVVSLSVGKTGSNVNYLLEALAGITVAGGVLVSDLIHLLLSPDAAGRWRSRAALAAALPLLLLLPWTGLSHTPNRGNWIADPTPDHVVYWNIVLDELRRVQGPILSEDLSIPPLLGRQLDFHPFMLPQLVRLGLWDPEPFLKRVREREYELLVLETNLEDPGTRGADMFTPEMLAAMRENYRWVPPAVGRLLFYTPRER